MPEAMTLTGVPLIGAGIALNAPDVVHQLQFRQESLRDELGPQGSPGISTVLAKSPLFASL